MFNFGGNNVNGAPSQGGSAGFSFGAKPAANAPSAGQPQGSSSGFSFGAKPTANAPSTGPPQGSSSGFSFGAKPVTTPSSTVPPSQEGSTGFSFGVKPETANSSTAPVFSNGGITGLQSGGASTSVAPGFQADANNVNSSQEFLSKTNGTNAKIPKKSKINALLDGCHLLPTNDSLRDIASLTTLNVSITPSLNELCETSSLLNQKLSKVGDNLTRAHYLLSGSGFNVHEAEQFIDKLKKVSKNKRLARVSKSINSNAGSLSKRNSSATSNKIETYLKDKKQENILSSIEESLNDSDPATIALDNETYAQKKNDLKAHFGITSGKGKKAQRSFSKASPDLDEFSLDSPNSTFSFLSSGRKPKISNSNKKLMLLQSFPNCKINVNSSQTQRGAFEEYAKIVYKHNSKDSNVECGSLIDMIYQYLRKNGENNQINNRHLLECLELLNFQIEDLQKELPLNKKSQLFLEQQFHNYIIDFYSKSSINEGLPSTVNKYVFYISSKLQNPLSGEWQSSNLTIVNNMPIWGILYYLLRGGCTKEVYDYIISQKIIFNKICPQLPTFIKHYVKEGMLTSELQQRILLEYKLFKNDVNVDPYKLAVFKIIGKLDLNGPSGGKVVSDVIESMEDWAWFHLAVLTKGENESKDFYKVKESSDQYTFNNFKQLVVSLGEQQFGLKSYYQILLLTGLYENLTEYIVNDKNRFNIDSAHLLFAIHDSLKLDMEQFTEVGLPVWKIFTSFMQSFIISDPKIVVEYLILFFKPLSNDGNDRNNKVLQLTQSLIKELIEYSKDYTAILGRVNLKTGVIQQGYLEKRAPILRINNGTDIYQRITESCAFKAEEEGRFEDAILLYHLSNNLDSVFTIVNKTLGDLLSSFDYLNVEECQNSFNLQNKDSNSILNKAMLINKHYTAYSTDSASKISKENKLALPVLLKIADIWQQFLTNDVAGTLDSLTNLNLVPIYDTSAKSTSVILTQGKELSELLCIDAVLKNLSNILILTMTCIQRLTSQLQGLKQQPQEVKDKTRKNLQQISKNCMTFVGITSYRLSKETYTILLNIESELYK